MGRGHGGGGGGERGGGEQGRGHQQELGLWSCHPVYPQHTHDMLVTHESVSKAAICSSFLLCKKRREYKMQCSCHVRASMGPAVQALHLNTRIFHFCHLGKTLREQPSPILKQFILEYSWLSDFYSTDFFFAFF